MMDFQVNESTYFLDIDDERQEWSVFVKTPKGTTSVPVYVDEETSVEDTIFVVEDKRKRKIVN